MPAIRAILAAGQAAEMFSSGLTLSKALKQPPVEKTSAKWENDASPAPAKAKRSKLEIATGITAIGTALVPLVAGVTNLFTRNKSLPESQATGDHETSPATIATEVSEIVLLLKKHAFDCKHTYDLSFECKKKEYQLSPRYGRSTDLHYPAYPKVSIHFII